MVGPWSSPRSCAPPPPPGPSPTNRCPTRCCTGSSTTPASPRRAATARVGTSSSSATPTCVSASRSSTRPAGGSTGPTSRSARSRSSPARLASPSRGSTWTRPGPRRHPRTPPTARTTTPDLRQRIQELYQASWREYWAHVKIGKVAFQPGETRFSHPWVDLDEARATPAPNEFADDMDTHPVLLIVCVALEALAVLDHGLPRQSIVGGGSIYPFCHNIILKAPDEGLGGVMTQAIFPGEAAPGELLVLPEPHRVASLRPAERQDGKER